MPNSSFYPFVLALLVLITVATWQFFSLTERQASLAHPYASLDMSSSKQVRASAPR